MDNGSALVQDIAPLRDFVRGMTDLADAGADEARFLQAAPELLRRLVLADNWLPPEYAAPTDSYRQLLLHCDPLERFSVVCFVWGPGQKTPVHNHTVWGLVGVHQGEEISTEMRPDPHGGPMRPGRVDRAKRGDVVVLSSDNYDIHRVENAVAGKTSISIHVYGANIGAVKRAMFNAETSQPEYFISGYDNQTVPNLWDRSRSAG
ncbi:MAG: cysteine dioxygenase [Roseomonas sp.]|nr:cysteine dioxygenase [Roseomonas sp.]MCA3329187.1 cysteine dioxygenase [Roseomonas sp.]MCA3331076.1 cysteine dioxygenase [Roseomonas sp.]MCA3334926.1 cysteine dioxygenase [Roseomonas sp.]MCA3348473.1 cysteine dioxygenase [Roseomonas sp.]